MSMNPSDIMSMVQEIEGLPQEVLDVVIHRKQEREKADKKAMTEQKQQMAMMIDAQQAFNPQQPVQQPLGAPSQQPSTQDALLNQLLGTGVGGLDEDLLI